MLKVATTEHRGKDGPLNKQLTGTIVYSCDGQFYVSTWLGFSPQSFNQKLIYVLLWKHFADVIKVCNQLALTREN